MLSPSVLGSNVMLLMPGPVPKSISLNCVVLVLSELVTVPQLNIVCGVYVTVGVGVGVGEFAGVSEGVGVGVSAMMDV